MLEWFGWLTNTLALESCRETLSTWGKPQGCSENWAHKRPVPVFHASRVVVFIWQGDPEHLSLCSFYKMKIHKACSVLYFLFSCQSGRAALPEIGNKVSQRITNYSDISLETLPCDQSNSVDIVYHMNNIKSSQCDIKSYQERLWKKKKKKGPCFI